jgi:hypothetical protein
MTRRTLVRIRNRSRWWLLEAPFVALAACACAAAIAAMTLVVAASDLTRRHKDSRHA